MPKILIFDAEKMLRDMYVTKFSMEGFSAVGYESPTKNPVKIVLKEKPDIISMDILMPEMDGFEATKQIKADRRTKDIPLFFLTNLGQQQDTIKGRGLGAVEYFVKAEYSPSDIVNYVKEIIGQPSQIVETTKERVKRGRRFLDRLLGRR